ncbi:MAG: hypothetical protein HQL32_02895 [Planctomycetes bacterium]|nr:hypothetical protein [Planctomycetota bacterium]
MSRCFFYLPGTEGLIEAKNMTIAFQIFINSKNKNHGRVIGNYNLGEGGFRVYLGPRLNGNITIHLWGKDKNRWSKRIPLEGKRDRWLNIVCTWKGSKYPDIYIDGEQRGTVNDAYHWGTTTASGSPLRVGCHQPEGNEIHAMYKIKNIQIFKGIADNPEDWSPGEENSALRGARVVYEIPVPDGPDL